MSTQKTPRPEGRGASWEEWMRMRGRFILQDRMPVPCNDILEWARWFENANRSVAYDIIGNTHVSTVFLGIDHSFGRGPPLLFETAIFGGPHDQQLELCTTWDEAEKQHAACVAVARSGLN